MKKCILALTLTFAFSLAAFAQSSYGDQSSKSQSSAQPSSSAQSSTSTDKTSTSSGKEKGVTGCLEQGSSAGSYVIKNAKHPDGIQVSYSGSEDLSKHVGHKVKATGNLSGDTLNATDVKHISETCSVGASSGGHKHSSSKTTGEGTDTGMNTKSGSTTSPNPK